MSKELVAFADEYGNSSFNFTSQGTHFIVASVIVGADALNSVEQSVEEVRKRYFQKGEIKSQKVADNHVRRLKVLNDLMSLDFSIYALVVDKQKLFGEGFKYKPSFYKFLNGLLYRELYRAYPKLKLYVDEHGGNDFLVSFKKYVHNNHIRDLFQGADFSTADSKNSNLIQVADFVAGTLGRCYDLNKNIIHRDKFLEVLKPRLSAISYFPREYSNVQQLEEFIENENDGLINRYAKTLAIDFIETKALRNQQDIDQLNCVKLLLMHYEAFGSKKYLTAKELMSHLNSGRNKVLKDQQFRSTVIGKLRDQGILIASSSRGDKKGYRLPTGAHDLVKFIDHGNSIVLPILHRIELCREKVRLATNNELDILDLGKFSQLERLMNV